MSGALHMAWRYLTHNRLKSIVLLLSITLIIYIPVGLRLLVRQSERQLTARAAETPLLIGAKGSPVELVLNGLYFAADVPEPIEHGEVARIDETELALAIPLHVRFRSREDPIVGTTLDYLDFRGLRVDAGRPMVRLGECVLGANVARRRALSPGDSILSSPESVFDLAGVYPLKMHVAGVLAFTDRPDDDAIFVDVRTAWIIEGLGHGHEDLRRPEAAAGVLRRDGNTITANASVVQYNEITDENIGSFHFHGQTDDFPITGVLAVPPGDKAAALLLGRYQSNERLQMVRPIIVMDELLATVLTVQQFVVAALVCAGLATLGTAALVFALSLRLRRREIETMMKIGGARRRIASIIVLEVAGILAASILLAAGLTWMTGMVGADVVRTLILQ